MLLESRLLLPSCLRLSKRAETLHQLPGQRAQFPVQEKQLTVEGHLTALLAEVHSLHRGVW